MITQESPEIKRDEYFMEQALKQARTALDTGEFPVGCVIACGEEIVASGRRKNSRGHVNELDHAEMVALRNLYLSVGKINFSEVTVYSTMEPCLMCFSALIVSGVKKYVYSYEDVMGGGTKLPLNMLTPLYSEMKVSITGDVLREKSLKLFKDFFTSPDCDYLQDSFLAEYTLKQ